MLLGGGATDRIMKPKSKTERRTKISAPAPAACQTTRVSTARFGYPVIAMAASAGGLKALSVILGGLPADFPAMVVSPFLNLREISRLKIPEIQMATAKFFFSIMPNVGFFKSLTQKVY